MIAVEQLNRSYGKLLAVNNVSFSISQGEVIGLLGPNGAGKTTIMKMMCGFLEPSSGRISIANSDVATQTKQAQANIGYLPENLPVYPEMTVVAYLEYAAGLRGIAQEQQPAEIRRVIAATELQEKAFSRIGDLSRGLKQRVGVAQALLGDPKVLILDEPTNGLDPTQTQHMRALIRELAKNATVILSTHILSEVEAVCDRVLMVRRGELVLDAPLDELQQGGSLSVQTNLTEQQLTALANPMAGIEKLSTQSQNGICTAQVSMAAEHDPAQLSAALARAVIENGGELYQLYVEQRDLETLFRDLTRDGGLSHAA